MESFASRVLARTGTKLDDLPVRHAAEGDTMGHIMCHRGNVYVCAVGLPDHIGEDGTEYFDEFEVVSLNP